MTASKVLELVERFDRNLEAYKSASYKEAYMHVEFITRALDYFFHVDRAQKKGAVKWIST